MRKLLVYLMVVGFFVGGSGLAQADTVTLTPVDLTGDPRPGDPPGSQTPPIFTGLYAWDWDADKPIGSLDKGGATGFGNSSWYSDVSGSAAGTGRPYTTFRFFPENIFGNPVTVGDLVDITYWSNWVGGDVDWQLRIYTKPLDIEDWFGERANFNLGTLKDGDWHLWSASSLGVNWLQNKNGIGTLNTYGVTWDDFLYNAIDEEIMMIDIGASYGTNSPPSYTYLDGVTISVLLDDGPYSQSMNLAAVPEPATMLLLGLGLVGLAGIRRKFRS